MRAAVIKQICPLQSSLASHHVIPWFSPFLPCIYHQILVDWQDRPVYCISYWSLVLCYSNRKWAKTKLSSAMAFLLYFCLSSKAQAGSMKPVCCACCIVPLLIGKSGLPCIFLFFQPFSPAFISFHSHIYLVYLFGPSLAS